MRYQGFYEITEILIEKLKEAGCKEVTIGSTDGYSRKKLNVTPQAHIAPVSVQISNNRNSGSKTVSLSCEVFIFEQITATKLPESGAKYGHRNEIDALDTTLYICDKFLDSLSPTIKTDSGGFLRISNGVTFNAALDQGIDEVTGMIGTISALYTPGSTC